MRDFKKYFENKKITVMGLGVLGRGVGDTAFLAECGAEVLVTDLKTELELKESVEKLKNYPNLEFVLGEHRKEDFEGVDMILKSAGVPLDSPYIEHAHKGGVMVEMSASLFAQLSEIPVIGVTGTRGKSTVTHMVHHTLVTQTKGSTVLLGGNVRGVSNLQLLKDVHEDSIAVLELDSWQLQGFGERKVSPQIAVFTNFLDDHLNYYKNNRNDYFNDKANIFLFQEESDVLVTTPEVFEIAKEYAKTKGMTFLQEVVLTDVSTLPESLVLQIPGEHNRLNAAIALKALQATSLSDELILEGLSTFQGVSGRLELLREVDGVKIYNDNNATTPDATVAALEALSQDRNIVLIAGGSDKGLDTAELASVVDKKCKHVVLYSGSGTEELKKVLPGTVAYEEYKTLTECVESARRSIEKGDILLFSPSFSSFGEEFENEYDRNDKFVEIVKSL